MPHTKNMKNNKYQTHNKVNAQENNSSQQDCFDLYPNIYESEYLTSQKEQIAINKDVVQIYFEILGFEQTSVIQILSTHAAQYQILLLPYNQNILSMQSSHHDDVMLQHYGIVAQGTLECLDKFFIIVQSLFPNKLLKGNIAEFFIQRLALQNLSVCVVESCTGGTISTMITSVHGASKVYKGGITAYSIESKKHILNIKDSLFKEFGVYSEECVKAMARAALNLFQADIALATSGLAAPDTSQNNFLKLPTGLVFICVLMKNKMPLVISQNFAISPSKDLPLSLNLTCKDSCQRVAIQHNASIESLRLALSIL